MCKYNFIATSSFQFNRLSSTPRLESETGTPAFAFKNKFHKTALLISGKNKKIERKGKSKEFFKSNHKLFSNSIVANGQKFIQKRISKNGSQKHLTGLRASSLPEIKTRTNQASSKFNHFHQFKHFEKNKYGNSLTGRNQRPI